MRAPEPCNGLGLRPQCRSSQAVTDRRLTRSLCDLHTGPYAPNSSPGVLGRSFVASGQPIVQVGDATCTLDVAPLLPGLRFRTPARPGGFARGNPRKQLHRGRFIIMSHAHSPGPHKANQIESRAKGRPGPQFTAHKPQPEDRPRPGTLAGACWPWKVKLARRASPGPGTVTGPSSGTVTLLPGL